MRDDWIDALVRQGRARAQRAGRRRHAGLKRTSVSEAADDEKLTDDGRFVVAGETLAFGWKGEPFGPEELARELLSALFEHI